MAYKSTLKHSFVYLSGELFGEILVSKHLIPNVGTDEADQLFSRVLMMQDEFINRVNHPSGTKDKKLTKAYFKKLRVDLLTEIDAISTEIAKLSK